MCLDDFLEDVLEADNVHLSLRGQSRGIHEMYRPLYGTLHNAIQLISSFELIAA